MAHRKSSENSFGSKTVCLYYHFTEKHSIQQEKRHLNLIEGKFLVKVIQGYRILIKKKEKKMEELFIY